MKKVLLLAGVISCIVFACSQPGQKTTDEAAGVATLAEQFMDNMAEFCGEALAGNVFIDANQPQLAGTPLIFDVATCTPGEIRIKTQLETEEQMTIILTLINDELLLKHDIRDKNNMPTDATMYGGFASDDGTALRQIFPVHNFGGEMWPGFENKSWEICITPEENKLEYMELTEDIIKRHFILEIPQL